jgi:hypothetical protein
MPAPIAEPINRGLAAQRAAETLLQTLGGTGIFVRLAVDSMMSSDAAQLGLESPATEEVLLQPVVVRNLTANNSVRAQLEVLIAAATLARAKEIYSVTDALDFFNSALGVIQRGKLFQVDSVDVDEFSGCPYLYRLKVSE